MNPTVTDVKPKTTEQVRADKRKRVIANAGKAAKRTSPKLASPLPKAHTPKAAVSNLSPAMPGFNEQTKAKFDLAVRALKGTRRLSEKLTIAGYHLQSDPTLRDIDPQELWRELQFSK